MHGAHCLRQIGKSSLSARRAWIEMALNLALSGATNRKVALRKESVDRNSMSPIDVLAVSVALRKESVDRNTTAKCKRIAIEKSLSARRAWIEIIC